MQQSKYRPCVRVSREVFSCAATKEMAAGLQGSFKTSWLEAGQHEEAEGDGTAHTRCTAQRVPPSVPRNSHPKGKKKKNLLFISAQTWEALPHLPPFFQDLQPWQQPVLQGLTSMK